MKRLFFLGLICSQFLSAMDPTKTYIQYPIKSLLYLAASKSIVEHIENYDPNETKSLINDVLSKQSSLDHEELKHRIISLFPSYYEKFIAKELTLRGHTNYINQASFDSTGNQLITSSRDKTAMIWDTNSGSLLATLPHNHEVQTGQFRPDDKQIVTASFEGCAKVWDWDASPGTLLFTLNHENAVVDAQYCKESPLIVTASTDGTAKVWHAHTGQLLYTLAHGETVNKAKFDPTGSYILTCGANIHLWKMQNNECHSTRTFLHGINVVGNFNADGTKLITAIDESAGVWETHTGNHLFKLNDEHDYHVAKFCGIGSGEKVATASRDGTAKVWRAENGALIHTLQHLAAVWDINFNSRCTHIATSSLDRTARIWNANTGNLIRQLNHKEGVTTAQFDASDSRLFTTAGNTAYIWALPKKFLSKCSLEEIILLMKLKQYGNLLQDHFYAKRWEDMLTHLTDREQKVAKKERALAEEIYARVTNTMNSI